MSPFVFAVLLATASSEGERNASVAMFVAAEPGHPTTAEQLFFSSALLELRDPQTTGGAYWHVDDGDPMAASDLLAECAGKREVEPARECLERLPVKRALLVAGRVSHMLIRTVTFGVDGKAFVEEVPVPLVHDDLSVAEWRCEVRQALREEGGTLASRVDACLAPRRAQEAGKVASAVSAPAVLNEAEGALPSRNTLRGLALAGFGGSVTSAVVGVLMIGSGLLHGATSYLLWQSLDERAASLRLKEQSGYRARIRDERDLDLMTAGVSAILGGAALLLGGVMVGIGVVAVIGWFAS